MESEQKESAVLIDKKNLADFVQKKFPPVLLSFAYGSGVFEEQSLASKTSQTEKMIDLILVVDNLLEFHEENLNMNSMDYSGASRLFGARYIKGLQKYVSAVHFNPDVPAPKELFSQPLLTSQDLSLKYGVIGRQSFKKDLVLWDHLITAGRLHKPVVFVTRAETDNYELNEAIAFNTLAAASLSLLICFDEVIEESEFFDTICSLSYIGDVRFSLGAEAPDKIQAIVRGNYARFRKLYSSVLSDESNILSSIAEYDHVSGKIHLECSEKAEEILISCVPEFLASEYTGRDKNYEVSFEQIQFENVQKILRECLILKNRRTSRQLIYYNLLATSPLKNISYAFRKLKKGFLK